MAQRDAGCQTAHEIGISLGVATLSAIATAATLSGGLASGYREGMLVAAVIAGVLALGTLLTVPSIWPAGASARRMHGHGLGSQDAD